MEHIKFDKIQSYIEKQTTGPDHIEIEGHLAVCNKCNEIYLGLKLLEKPLCESFEEAAATPSCPEDWEMAALVRDELPIEFSNKITGHLTDCNFCIGRAANYYRALSYEKDTRRNTRTLETKGNTGDRNGTDSARAEGVPHSAHLIILSRHDLPSSGSSGICSRCAGNRGSGMDTHTREVNIHSVPRI